MVDQGDEERNLATFRREVRSEKRADDQRKRRELAQAFDDAVVLLLSARACAMRYMDSEGGLTGFGHLVLADLDEARLAIGDIEERLMNL